MLLTLLVVVVVVPPLTCGAGAGKKLSVRLIDP